MDFLNEYGNYSGIFLGVCTFIIIGIFHPIVIKAEYYWGKKCWWIFCSRGNCSMYRAFVPSHDIIISPFWEYSASPVYGVSKKYSSKKSG
jgi:hypothetical protein